MFEWVIVVRISKLIFNLMFAIQFRLHSKRQKAIKVLPEDFFFDNKLYFRSSAIVKYDQKVSSGLFNLFLYEY